MVHYHIFGSRKLRDLHHGHCNGSEVSWILCCLRSLLSFTSTLPFSSDQTCFPWYIPPLVTLQQVAQQRCPQPPLLVRTWAWDSSHNWSNIRLLGNWYQPTFQHVWNGLGGVRRHLVVMCALCSFVTTIMIMTHLLSLTVCTVLCACIVSVHHNSSAYLSDWFLSLFSVIFLLLS